MDLQKAIEAINKYNRRAYEENKKGDFVGLSNTLVNLSVFNSYLAPNIAGMHHEATQGHLTAYKAARELDQSIGDATNQAKQESLDKRTEYEKVKYVYYSNAVLIGSIEKRISAIQTQLKQEGINQ